MRGLMASYHQKWDASLVKIEKILKANLRRAKNSRGRVGAWNSVEAQLIGREAPGHFAAACIADGSSAFGRLSKLGLRSDSTFARSAAEKLIMAATNDRQDATLLNFAATTLFPEDDSMLSPIAWGRAFDSAVSSLPRTASEEDQQKIIDLALRTRKLPDPRINIVAWQNVPERARKTIMQWLSKEDLRFFFDLIMEGQSDPQGRYPFWIKYAGEALRARVVVSEKDEWRLEEKLLELKARGRSYAKMENAGGANSNVSAFIMDFGEVTVVEFSKINSACYVYANSTKDPYVDFSQDSFSWRKLKNTKLGKYYAHAPGWPATFERILAQHGIRPE
jgi:hypothetical protein